MLKAKQVSVADQDRLLAALIGDHRRAGLGVADRSMLDYAVKLTERPSEISAGDIENLRQSGFDDRGIHDLCAITAYFAFVNRIADGLGVELEGEK